MIKLIFFILALTFIGCHTKENADLIVLNAKIYTVDSAFSLAEAMAIKDGKILALGKAESILDSYVAKEKFDANGKFIYPGFIDAHAHFVGYGKSLFEVQLYDSKTWNEVIGRVTRFAKNNPNEKWI
ncbi:MAG: amidohydrolase family protein, partial [Chitinophagaceae bacterium]|nr:amidohydrolase family protein [Chitinophagaceae bacterium]